MIKSLVSFIREQMADDAPTQEASEARLRLVTAALLVEVMAIDGHLDDAEGKVLRSALRDRLGLAEADIDQLIERAREEVDHATSLFEFTTDINGHCDQQEKNQLIEWLWRMAYADGMIDALEEATIRQVAELIHVPHSAFIRAKHRAREVNGH